MLRRMRGRLTYANVAATLALFIALGGTSYAAATLPANSVGTKQLKNQAVTAQKVANDTLTGQQINVSKLGTVPSALAARTATNAKALGGLGPASYFQESGAGNSTLVAVNGGASKVLTTIPGWGELSAQCDATCGAPTLTYTNTTGKAEAVDYFTCSGSNDYNQVTVPAHGTAQGITVGTAGGYQGQGPCEYGVDLWSTSTRQQAEAFGGATVQPSGASESVFSTSWEILS